MKLDALKKGTLNPSSYYVFDTETRGLNATKEAFICGAIVGGGKEYFFTSIPEMIERMQTITRHYKSATFFAHNLEYDLGVLFGNIVVNASDYIYVDSRLITCKIEGIKFADSFNIMKASVETIGNAIGIAKPSLNYEGDTMENYRIRCIQDCVIVHAALTKYFSFTQRVHLTIGSLSLTAFRQDLQKPLFYTEESRIFRKSYRGGRTEAFYLGKLPQPVNFYDYNRFYPWLQANIDYPDPDKVRLGHKHRMDYYLEHYEGVAEVTVNVPDMFYPPLPYTSEEGKLLFPTGTFKAWLNFNELRYSISLGVTIVKVHTVYYSPTIESPFKAFINRFNDMLMNTTNQFEKNLYKDIQRNFYGKFGQVNRGLQKYIDDLTPEIMAEYYVKYGERVSYTHFNEDRKDAVAIIKPLEKDLYYRHSIFPFPSYITSGGRIVLHKGLVETQSYYCDTDSLVPSVGGFPSSDKLGELKKEEKKMVYIYGNKHYEYEERDTVTERAKGISKRATFELETDDLGLTAKVWKWERMVKSKEALRKGLIQDTGKFLEVKRKPSLQYDKRRISDSGYTYPLHIK